MKQKFTRYNSFGRVNMYMGVQGIDEDGQLRMQEIQLKRYIFDVLEYNTREAIYGALENKMEEQYNSKKHGALKKWF